MIQISKELHQGDRIFSKPRAFFLWLPRLGWKTNSTLAQMALIEECSFQKGGAGRGAVGSNMQSNTWSNMQWNTWSKMRPNVINHADKHLFKQSWSKWLNMRPSTWPSVKNIQNMSNVCWSTCQNIWLKTQCPNTWPNIWSNKWQCVWAHHQHVTNLTQCDRTCVWACHHTMNTWPNMWPNTWLILPPECVTIEQATNF